MSALWDINLVRRPDDPMWVYVGTWPRGRNRPVISVRVSHLWVQISVACLAEDYGRVSAAGDHAPRCAECVRWWVGGRRAG